MTRTASMAALLHVALQDLWAGRRLLAERLGTVVDAASNQSLTASLDGERARSRIATDQLAVLTDVADAPENLWMAGILDDAERDTKSHQPGAVLDVAIVGAIRKALAAEIVSLETAQALADIAAPDMRPTIDTLHAASCESDRALARQLRLLTATR